MKTILTMIDFSEISTPVLELARQLAQATGASVYLLHVATPEPDFIGYGVGPQTVRDGRAKELREEHHLLEQMKEDLQKQDISTEALLLQGVAVDKILQEADRLGADLLVMGSHGHGALRRLLLGSVTQGVLKKATRPVLIVPLSSGE